MFYFTHPLFVGPDLDPLVFSVRTSEALLTVGWGMRVEDSNIKICLFEAATPETIGSNIQPSTILGYCRGTSEGFIGDWL